jgi:hypothetical protein
MAWPKITLRTTDAAPLMVGDLTLVLRSRSVVVTTASWGWVWNRPIAVLVQGRKNTYQHPLVDMTKMMRVAAIGMVVSWAMTMFGKYVYSLVQKVR